MTKILILIVLGLLLGLGLAIFIQNYRPPPGRRTPRPNVLKRDKLHQAVLPIGVALGVLLLIWGATALFYPSDDQEKSTVRNRVTQPVPVDERITEVAAGVTSSAGVKEKSGRLTDGDRASLVIDSPAAKAAVMVSPVSSALDPIGVGLRDKFYPAKALAARIESPAQSPEKPAPGNVQPVSTPTKPAAPASAPVQPAPLGSTTPAPPAEPPPPAAGGTASTPKSSLRYTVHLASFGLVDNARRSLNRLKSAGVPAFLSKIEVNHRVYHRLMAGSFATRQQALAYGQALRDRGLTAGLGQFVIKPIVAPSVQ